MWDLRRNMITPMGPGAGVSVILFLLSVLKLSIEIERTPKEIEAKLRTYDVVPDFMKHPPNDTIAVKYQDGFSLDLGEELVPRDLKEPPHHVRFSALEDHFYTLLFTDLDVPSRETPSMREYLLWAVGNINGSDAKMCKIEEGETLAEYIPPFPKNTTGFHRFVYHAYLQPEGKKVKFLEPYLRAIPDDPKRYHFSSAKFAKKYNLGDPLFINFFTAEWKPYYNQSRSEGIKYD